MTPREQMAGRACLVAAVAALVFAGLERCGGGEPEPSPQTSGPAIGLERTEAEPDRGRLLVAARAELVSLRREWAGLQGACERAREDAGLDVESFRRQYGDFVVAGIGQAIDRIDRGDLESVDEPFRIDYADGAWVDTATVDTTIGAARALAAQCPQLFGGWLRSWGELGRWR